MENSMTDGSISNFLPQSYSLGIENITGTKDYIVHFQIPKEVLENRIKTWDNLFDKYLEKMSDDIELNLETLEPEEEEFSDEDYSCGVPICKSATLIQYWINTGNTGYSALFKKNESSESDSFVLSLSEEEIDSPIYSSFLSKKADAMAIMEGAKSNSVKSSKNYCFEDATAIYSDKTKKNEGNEEKMEKTAATDSVTCNKNSSDVSHNTSYSISQEKVALKINNELGTSKVISINTIQPDMSSLNSQSLLCDIVDKTDVLETSQNSPNSHKMKNIVSIMQHFNKVSKQCSIGDKNHNTLDESKVLKKHSIDSKQVSASMAKKKVKDHSISFHRKKLYTGRNSPVDLAVTITCNTDLKQSKSPNIKLSTNSHPALDPDNLSKKMSLIYKNKHSFPSSTKILSPKNVRTKKRGKKKPYSVSNKNIASERTDVTNDNRILDSTVDNSSKNLSVSSSNEDKRNDDNLIRDCNDINMSKENITQRCDLTSDENQVVLLEQASLKKHKAKSDENENITQDNNVRKDSVASTLDACDVENLGLTSSDSNQSTILVYKCNNIASQDLLSTSSSLYLKQNSIECNLSVMNSEQINSEPTNLKNAYINQIKESFVRLTRLPQSVHENDINTSQVLNMNDDLPVCPEKPCRSKMDSSNSHGTNIKNDVKLREVRVVLQRLPVDTYFKGSSSTTNISSPADKDKVSRNANTGKNKRKTLLKKTIRRSNGKKEKTSARTIHKINNSYSLRVRRESKKDDDEINNTSNNVAKRNDEVFNATKSNFISPYQNHNSRVSQNRCRKFSVLGFISSSDEDDLAQLIRPPTKRLKTLIDDKTSKTRTTNKDIYDETKLVSTNKDKYDSKNINMRIYSSKQDNLRKINKWTREKNRRGMVGTKSGSDTLNDSFRIYKYKSSFFPRRNDHSDSATKDSNISQNKYLFPTSKNISNNNEKYINERMEENRISHKKDTCVTLYQTKTFNRDSSTDSSDLDRYNNDTFIYKSPKTASVYNNARDNGHTNKEHCNNPYAKIYTNKRPIYQDEYTEKYVASKMQNLKNKSRLTTGTAAKTSESFDKSFNNNINLRITTETTPYVSFISNARDSAMQRDNTILNTSHQYNDLNKLQQDRQMSKKFDLMNFQDNQQRNITFNITNCLTFQTKNYYSDSDSDSNYGNFSKNS
ncbi:PREDICTED: putative uncharacterized protein DDB_G0282133 isoform X2 [Dinoponera quadriceps]|uniref:Uncharacterized protein n=1 Tax=Dinoponera quadriceps TaxID=609295 RepID=A0A6P3WTD3_DINQU|nr:PREDICTED: putative uncharacterized protein DDB_G0282133 isoform X2 [Dinoponera quadriceps]